MRNAATFNLKGHKVAVWIGPTGKKTERGTGISHAEAMVEVDGEWKPIINRNGFAVVDDKGDGLIKGVSHKLTLLEACEMLLPKRGR